MSHVCASCSVPLCDLRNTGASASSAAAAAACLGPDAAKAAAAAAEKKEDGDKSTAPRLAEEDLVFFRVRRSVEGYPQAVCVQRLQKLTGTVVHPPSTQPGQPQHGALTSDEARAKENMRFKPSSLQALKPSSLCQAVAVCGRREACSLLQRIAQCLATDMRTGVDGSRSLRSVATSPWGCGDFLHPRGRARAAVPFAYGAA